MSAPPLNRITTEWSQINNPHHFLLRYAGPIRAYLTSLLGEGGDADDVAQEFFLSVVQGGFARATPDRGRFRDYLKVAIRNAALSHLRRRGREPVLFDPATLQHFRGAERGWLEGWSRCLLERAWDALERHERSAPGNLAWTALRLAADHPDDDSVGLAGRASDLAGRVVNAAAFRKQLSRGRRLFAELLVREVERTVEDATPARVQEELRETGLLRFVEPFLGG